MQNDWRMESNKFKDIPIIINTLKPYLCTAFCQRCPENKFYELDTCKYVCNMAVGVYIGEHGLSDDDKEIMKNKFVCPYNVERLVNQK